MTAVDSFEVRVRRALDGATMDTATDFTDYVLLGSGFERTPNVERLLSPVLTALVQVAQAGADAQGLTRAEFVAGVRKRRC